jgi:hypothetical protein
MKYFCGFQGIRWYCLEISMIIFVINQKVNHCCEIIERHEKQTDGPRDGNSTYQEWKVIETQTKEEK